MLESQSWRRWWLAPSPEIYTYAAAFRAFLTQEYFLYISTFANQNMPSITIPSLKLSWARSVGIRVPCGQAFSLGAYLYEH